jgi:hypothetical protein
VGINDGSEKSMFLGNKNGIDSAVFTYCGGQHYGKATIEAFVNSFNRVCNNSILIIFTADVNASLIEFAEEFDNILLVSSEEKSAELRQEGYDVFSLRYFLYKEFLDKNPGQFAKILLTDSRDVIFQADPFGHIDTGIVLAPEDNIFRHCPTNSSWLRIAYGEKMLSIMRDFSILCAGTTIGGTESVLEYLGLVCQELSERKGHETIDQAVHNFVVRGPMADASTVDAKNLIFATLHHTPPEDIRLVGREIFVRSMRPAIVHQYDRHDKLRSFVNGLGLTGKG